MNESKNMNLEESQQEASLENTDVNNLVPEIEEINAEENTIEQQIISADFEEENEQEEVVFDPLSSKEENNSEMDESSQQLERKEDYKNQLENFFAAFNTQSDLEAKLVLAIDFMESSLGLGGTPHFRNFWEARRLSLPLFKENISPNQRNTLWVKFSELSKEARRLKEILDEQSAFAVEQIEIAITALEQEIQNFDEQVSKYSLAENFTFPQFLENKKEFYFQFQKQLNILNTQASRINALRKELLKTEMRIRQKNKFFQRLSSAGDLVFPKRKDLIKQISQEFMKDVEEFISVYFEKENFHNSLYTLREEIKFMQGLAKVLTLNTHSFTQTRMRLSGCWDKIKVEEKSRKKEKAHLKVLFKENADLVREDIKSLNDSIDANTDGNVNQWQNHLNEIVSKMRATELGRDELKELRDELHEVRKKIQDIVKNEENKRLELEEQSKLLKRAKYQGFKDQVAALIAECEPKEVDVIVQERDELFAQIQESTLTKNEKLELERLSKPLRDIITDKKEKALLNLSDDDRQSLSQLQEVLKQRKERKLEIKSRIEVLRKASGSSSLDFEKAMEYTTQVNEEKERLEKINQGIAELEEQINQLKSKIKGK